MKAVTWQGIRHVSVEEVPDPFVEAPTDAVIRATTTSICCSDLHRYEPMAPFMAKGKILGHENMGQVVEVGSECSARRRPTGFCGRPTRRTDRSSTG